MLSVYPPPPMYQPSDYGITVPSAQLQGNPVPMLCQEDSPFPAWEPWNPSYPLSVPHLLPGFAPEDPSLQQPWSMCDLHQDPQWREVEIFCLFPVNLRICDIVDSGIFLYLIREENVKLNEGPRRTPWLVPYPCSFSGVHTQRGASDRYLKFTPWPPGTRPLLSTSIWLLAWNLLSHKGQPPLS